MLSSDELRGVIVETTQLSEALERHCMNEMGYSSTEFFMIFNLYRFALNRLNSVTTLLSESKFEDCFILLRTVFETYMHLLLVTKGKRYRETVPVRVKPNAESTAEEARDKKYDKWVQEWKSGFPNYASVINIQKSSKRDTILVTYEWEGLYSTDDPERKGRPISRQLFAIEDYDPEERFVSSLPGIVEGDAWAEYGEPRIDDQKRTYHSFMRGDSLIRNLRLNAIITRLQKTRVIVHYSYLSSFTHPSRRAINPGEELRHMGARSGDVEHLILLYVAKFHELLLSIVSEFFSTENKNAQLDTENALISRLKIVTKDFWFIFEDPTDFDVFDSDMRKETVKMVKGRTVDPKLTLYYPNPLDRLVKMRGFRRTRPGTIPPWVADALNSN